MWVADLLTAGIARMWLPNLDSVRTGYFAMHQENHPSPKEKGKDTSEGNWLVGFRSGLEMNTSQGTDVF